jgi:hypothetical protein
MQKKMKKDAKSLKITELEYVERELEHMESLMDGWKNRAIESEKLLKQISKAHFVIPNNPKATKGYYALIEAWLEQ